MLQARNAAQRPDRSTMLFGLFWSSSLPQVEAAPAKSEYKGRERKRSLAVRATAQDLEDLG